MSIRYTHVSHNEKYGDLPIERWEMCQESQIAARFDRRSGARIHRSATAYAKEYSWVAPKLWLRERPRLLFLLSTSATVAAVGIILGVLVNPAALLITTVAAVLAATASVLGFDGELESGGVGDIDRRRPVMEVSGNAVPEILDAYENDPKATLASLRVLAKGAGVTSDEALDLAAEIIGRLAKNQRELEEAKKVREEAEAAALAEFTATAEVAPIIDRSDEITLAQLSAELDLQGK